MHSVIRSSSSFLFSCVFKMCKFTLYIWLMSVVCVLCDVGLWGCRRWKNDWISYSHREHLHKQLALCKWSQLNFPCPISSITFQTDSYNSSTSQRLLRLLPHSVSEIFCILMVQSISPDCFDTGTKKNHFPPTERSEVRLGCKTASLELVGILNLAQGHSSRAGQGRCPKET